MFQHESEHDREYEHDLKVKYRMILTSLYVVNEESAGQGYSPCLKTESPTIVSLFP